ncbi:MAG: protein kinase [candidate division KSB1 bacterium]|jgi:tetratricopeptide (TPR) repeat protein|nr:protein kinase [candidate division KSB1 bacterium]
MEMDEKVFDDQHFAELLYELGIAYMERNQVDAAIEKYQEYIRVNGESDEVISRLSEAYLAKGAETEDACEIYIKSLRLHPENYTELMTRIIRIELASGKYSRMEQLSEKDLLPYREDPRIIPIYAHVGWQLQEYRQVANVYKLMMGVKFNVLIQKWLMLNYIKAAQRPSYQFKLDDLIHCYNYTRSVRFFERLRDIYIYLLVKMIIRVHFREDMIYNQKAISEFEFFLEDNVVSTKVDRVLNKKISIEKGFNFAGEIWDRPLQNAGEDGEDGGSNGGNGEVRPDPFAEHPVLVYIHVLNYEYLVQGESYKEMLDAFDSILHSTFDKESARFVKRVNDGYLIIGDDLPGAVMASSRLMKKYLAGKKEDDQKLHVNVGIHFRKSLDVSNFLPDMITLLDVIGIETDPKENESEKSGDSAGAYRVLITEPVLERLKESAFEIKPFGNTHLPFTSREMSVHSIRWTDGMDEFRVKADVKIGRFLLKEEVGENDFFVTFKAIDTYLERLVIIKILRPEFRADHEDHFLKTATQSAKMDHDNIAMIYDVGIDQGFAYIAREYIEGEPFGAEGRTIDPMDAKEAVRVITDLAHTIAYAHQSGVVHGGLRPGNLFRSNQDGIRITDFAPFRLTRPVRSRQYITAYDLSYMSPRIASGQVADEKDDIYGLGLMLATFMTGENPFMDNTKSGVSGKLDKFRTGKSLDIEGDIPEEIMAIILKALTFEYESIGDLVGDLFDVA